MQHTERFDGGYISFYVVLNLVLTLFCQDIEEEEYSRAYSQALHEGEAKNNRIPIMLVGQDRGGKTSLMRRLLGLPFNKDQPSTTGIDVNVIELTEQNAEDPWKKTEVKKFMTSESEAKTVLYQKTAEYFDGGV
jgi:GTPase SAR1 family protein